MVSSTVRSLSLIAPSGKVRRFEMRKDANLLLNPSQMGEFVHAANVSTLSFYKFLPKLGELRHMYLDFENLHALIFPMPDHNILLVTVEKMEPDIARMIDFILRLLVQEGMIHKTS